MTADSAAMPAGVPATSTAPPQIGHFKPRRGLFMISAIVFVIWVGCLLAMYFTTVWPHRHQRIAPPPTAIREQA